MPYGTYIDHHGTERDVENGFVHRTNVGGSTGHSHNAAHPHVKPPKPPRKSTRLTRKQKDQIYRDLGMTKVRGARGGIYYE